MGNTDEAEANARLISAAPELLAAAEYAAVSMKEASLYTGAYENLVLAIKKAKGEE